MDARECVSARRTTGRALKVGILGGMGPAATADFYAKLIRATPAARDQDHVPVVIWADPTIPDRTAALLDHGADPSPWLKRGAHYVALAGANLIAVPCNTAHAFLGAVRSAAAPVPVLDMVAETAEEVARSQPGATVGILATTGTLTAELYQNALSRCGLKPLIPDSTAQQAVMSAIRQVKAGGDLAHARRLMSPALRSLGQPLGGRRPVGHRDPLASRRPQFTAHASRGRHRRPRPCRRPPRPARCSARQLRGTPCH
ncbi:aspartate racemase [Streptomyces himastatinicus ATCC 53653]|uniref:Aspartate racemase n=2 Tax=Streptomyces violaceusniger group TaxID=2839105 RepID=D9WJV1_9ACTN|nr:aspartate racemase [Streptomyces himastatinicus ATCC 53653]